MKKLILILLFSFSVVVGFSQYTSKWVATDTIKGRTGYNVVVDSGLRLPHPVPELRIAKILGWEHTTGNVFSASILNLYDEIQQTLRDSSDAGNPPVYATWVRDTTNGYIYLAETTDKVGIGTTTPTEMLDVNGSINISTTTSTAGQIKQDGYTIFHTYSLNGESHNIFIGEYVGNFTMTGNDNIGMGSNTMLFVTSGSQNIGIGITSFSSITEGSYNTAVGNGAMSGTVTGSYNTAIGLNALYSNNNGLNNVGIGAYTLYNNIIGDSNVAIGYKSGYSSIGNRNIYIGEKAGYNETGSNKLYIENSNADSTGALIFGNFATNKVKVNGTLVSGTGTIANNDATPDVTGGNIFIYNGTANSVTLTDLDNPTVGAVYTIIGNSDTYVLTINDTGNFHLSGTWEAHIDDAITVYCKADNYYLEISRSHH